MNKTTIIIAVAIVAAAAYYYYDKQKNAGALGNTSTNPSTNPSTGGGTGGGGTPAPTPSRILARGSTGEMVKVIQRHYNANHKYTQEPYPQPAAYFIPYVPGGVFDMSPDPLTVDGVFGQKTEDALWYMYRKRQVSPDDHIDYALAGADYFNYPLNWLKTYQKFKGTV
jgi:hypothetical protein